MRPASSPFDDLGINHILFLVADLSEWLWDMSTRYGLSEISRGTLLGGAARCPAVLVGTGRIRIALGQVVDDDDCASAFVRTHGDAVADIALAVADVAGAFETALRRGGRPVRQPIEHNGVLAATIEGVGDLVHTFVERPPDGQLQLPPGLALPAGSAVPEKGPLSGVDHLAICVESGQLGDAIRYYTEVLDFRLIFEERIEVGGQAMSSAVVQSSSGDVTFTFLEQDSSRDPGQIDDFLKTHGGPGVQHVALGTDDVVSAVRTLSDRGVGFAPASPRYYDAIREKITPRRHGVEQLQELGILVDEDRDGQLFQIFTRAVHSRRSFFFELIERAGAVTFGTGNVQALYESRELDMRE